MRNLSVIRLTLLLAAVPICALAQTKVDERGHVSGAYTGSALPNSVSGMKNSIPGVAVWSESKVGFWDPLLDTVPVSGGGGGGGTSAVKATAADPTFIEGSTTNLPSADLSGYARSLVKGTVTANLGTIGSAATAANQTATQGSKGAGTAAANSELGGLVFNTSLPTLTTGQQAALQGDSSGRLIVNCGVGCAGGAQFAEDAVHASGDLGTVSLVVRKDTATQLAGADGDYSVLTNDASGRLHVNVGVSALPTGAATSAAQTAVQGTFGAQTANKSVIYDTSGNAVDWNAPVTIQDGGNVITVDGTVNAAQSGTWTVQPGNTQNTTPWLVTQAPSSASAAGVAIVASSAAEACHVLKAGGGNLYSVSGVIGAAGYIMVFNATSAPADGAVTPVVWAYAGAQGSFSIDYGSLPASFSTGITVCASSTGPFTKTAYSTNTAFSGRVQ